MPRASHQTAYSFVERLARDLQDATFELPAFPEAVIRVQRALQSEDTGAGDIVEILSSDPGLAARIVRTANSAAFKAAAGEITDLRHAVSQLGFRTVRTVAVEFALRQLRREDVKSSMARQEVESIWRDSLDIACICYVIAKHYTRVAADSALLCGLLHGLGRLYIVMRAESMTDVTAEEIHEVTGGWHATIGKAILESWTLPASLQHAVEHQDDLEYDRRNDEQDAQLAGIEGGVSLTDVLIVAKILYSDRDLDSLPHLPALRVLRASKNWNISTVLETHDEEIQTLRASLSD